MQRQETQLLELSKGFRDNKLDDIQFAGRHVVDGDVGDEDGTGLEGVAEEVVR